MLERPVIRGMSDNVASFTGEEGSRSMPPKILKYLKQIVPRALDRLGYSLVHKCQLQAERLAAEKDRRTLAATVAQRDYLAREVAHLRAPPSAAIHSRRSDHIFKSPTSPLGNEMDALAERYYGADANRKPTIYLAEYERLFGPMRNAPLRLLEIGVRFGASMFLWAEYFPNATIVGLDIDKKPENFPTEKRVHFIQGSQDDPATLDLCAILAGGQFDIIIDDASHIGRLSASSFSHLFPRALKPGGFYVIEDICTAFLSEFPDSEPYAPADIGRVRYKKYFPSHQAGMVGFVKQILDHVMAPVAMGRHSQYPIERMLVLKNVAILQKANVS